MENLSAIDELNARLLACGIKQSDIIEKFIRSGGPGGQNVNKTSSCVYLRHMPSGIEVKCQRERSQQANRVIARQWLLRKIQERAKKIVLAAVSLREKQKRANRRRPAHIREGILRQKKLRSMKKKLRCANIDYES